MTKITTPAPFFIKSLIIISFLIALTSHIQAQNLKFKVKLQENFTETFETLKQNKSSNGYVMYGIPELDSLNQRFKVVKMERLFNHAAKFEQRHRKAGLHRWYEIELDRNAIDTNAEMCLSSYLECKFISNAELYLDKKYVDNYDPKNNYESFVNPALSLVDSNDPLLNQQWHYENTGQSGGTAGADINLKNAWTIETGDPSVTVAIIDGGVDVLHQDLATNMWRNEAEINGNDGIDDDGNGYVDDKFGYGFGDDSGSINASEHGTHVAGTVGAVNNNGVGVSGVAGGSGNSDGIRMMSCAVFGSFRNYGFDEAFVYAADNGAVIAQNSWGYTSAGVYEQSVLDAIDYFIVNAGRDENGNVVGPLDGGIVIFASGNSNSSASYYPGFYDPVLSVASTNHNDIRSPFSNYGSWVDIAAPGSDVLSTFPNNTYSSISGTSMACPHVSGVAALVVSQFPDLTNDGLWNILTSTTDDINDLNPGFINQLGSGRLNAFLALQSNDGIPPSAIIDLALIDAEPTSITVNWSAPGGSDTVGVASEYDLRYSTSVIDDSNFYLADSLFNLPKPLQFGETQFFTINNLNPLTTYYVALKSKDFYGETSIISNVLAASTTDVPVIRIEPDNLYADLLSGDSISQTLTIFNDGNYPLNFEISNAIYESLNISKVNFGNPPHQSFQKDNYVSNRAGLFNLADSIDGNIIYKNDFEGDVSNWTSEVYSGDDLWHVTDLNSSSQVKSWHSGIVGGSNYNTGNRINSAIISPVITLNAASQDSIFLVFRESYETEVGWDYCMVDVTTDNGVTWQSLRGAASNNTAPSGSSNGWITSEYDLSAFSGESIKLRFYFDTKDGVEQNYPGWFFDDVIIFGGKPKWQSVSLQSAVVDAGESIDISVIFNAKGLSSGNYLDSLVFISNDPSNSIISIPTEIDVTGAPGIALNTTEINFDSLFINDSRQQTVQIRSVGTDTLLISDITLDSENFRIDSTQLALPADSEYELMVRFTPKTLGVLTDTLKIFSNDSQTPVLKINLTGYGVDPPVMTVTPDSIGVNIFAEDSIVQYLTIDNSTGGSNLYVNFDKFYGTNQINGQAIANAALNSHENGEEVSIEHIEKPSTQDKNILVIQNTLAWQVNMVDFIFEQTNILATGINSSALADFDLSNYDLIITVSSQNYTYYQDLSNQVEKLEEFVSGGGIIQYQVATQGSDVQLVGGVSATHGNLENINIVINSLHPIVTGLPQFLDGTSANHNYLSNLPGNAIEIIKTEQSNVTTLAEYQFGNGKVIASGMTLEFLHNSGFNSAPLLSQVLNYTLTKSGFDWLKFDQSNDTIPAGTTKEIPLNLSAKGLLGGIYEAEVSIISNDPVTPVKRVPVTMDVTGIPQISLSLDTLSFGKVFLEQSNNKTFIIKNIGSDLLEINSISSNSADYVIDSTNFNLVPGQAVELTVTYTPTIVGTNNIDLIIESNDTNNLLKVIKLFGEGVEPPKINVNPDSLSLTLNSGATAMENLLIDNSLGGSELDWQIDIAYKVAQPNNYLRYNENLNRGINNNNETVSNRVLDNMPLVAGEFSSLSNSPVPLTAVSINSNRTIIYAMENEGNNFYQYSIENGLWTSLTSSPVNSGNNGGAVELNGKIYHTFTQTNELVVYDISTDSWSIIASPLATGNIASDGNYVYLVGGFELYRLNTSTSEFVQMASPINSFNSWGGLEYYEGFLYGHIGNGFSIFTRYDISNDNWVTLPSIPGGAVLGSAIDPFNGKYYAYGSFDGNNWYEYNIDSVQWSVSSIPLFYVNDGGMVFSNKGAASGIYFIQGEYNSGFGLFETDPGFEWLSTNLLSGQINAGESELVELMIDATELTGGNYLAEIIISNNDPLNNIVKVPVNLEVRGEPILYLQADSLVYEPILIGQSNSKTLVVKNTGTDLLSVTEVSINNIEFSTNITSFDLSPNETISLIIDYVPTTEGEKVDQLTFISNDEDNSPASIALYSSVMLPAAIDLSQDSLTEILEQVSQSTQILTIDNTLGGSDLNFQLSQFIVSTSSSATNSEVFKGENINPNAEKTVVANSENEIHLQSRIANQKSTFSQEINLVELLDKLGSEHPNLTNLLSDNYLFSDGFTGNFISDGGNDMYDGGNYFNSNLGGSIYYTENLISTSMSLAYKEYFTAKYDGLFVFSGNVSEINTFTIDGNLGADGYGSVDGAIIEMTKNGVDYIGFVKRVYDANDPSVNHLIIVEDNGSVNHGFSTNTDSDYHTINNLTGINNLHYLLFAGDNGKYYDNSVMTNVMEAYLDLVDTQASWLTMEPSEGTIPAGQQMEVGIGFNSNNLEIGEYKAQIIVNHNDPAQTELTLPVSLNVVEEGAINVAPVINDQIFRIDENSSNGTIIGKIQATDPNGDSLIFSLISNEFNHAVAISNSGILTITDSAEFDFEKNVLMQLYVTVSDGEFLDSAEVVIIINDLEENAAPIINDQVFQVDENVGSGFEIGELIATDPDNDPLSFTLLSSQVEGAFSLNSNGILSVLDSSLIIFEVQTSIEIMVEVSDGILTDEATVTIEINEVEDEVLSNKNIMSNISLYPNPVTNDFIINYNFQTTIKSLQVIDVNGRILELKFQLNGELLNIDAKGLAAGLYQLIIKDGDHILQARFIKK